MVSMTRNLALTRKLFLVLRTRPVETVGISLESSVIERDRFTVYLGVTWFRRGI